MSTLSIFLGNILSKIETITDDRRKNLVKLSVNHEYNDIKERLPEMDINEINSYIDKILVTT